MGKQGKSSASSATRKKHARKAAAHDPSISIAPAPKVQGKGKGKGKNREPRIKQYIPPPKFKPIVEDPIENLAIASVMAPNMVLCFKGLSKKDPVTKTKALDELGSMLDEDWSVAMPVWLWHFVSLSIHSNRRLRELAASIHSKLLEKEGIREEVQSYILSEPNAGTFLAAWVLGANDIVSSVANPLQASWNSNIAWDPTDAEGQLIDIQDHTDNLASTLIQAIVDPEQLFRQFAPLLALSSKEGANANDSGESPQDRDARIRTTGLNTIAWILDGPPTAAHPTLLAALRELFSSNPLVGTIFSAQPSVTGADPSGAQTDTTAWGYEQRAVRIAGWKLVKTLVKYLNDSPNASEQVDDDSTLPLRLGFFRTLASAAIRSAWTETDAVVRSSMWDGLLPLITRFPEVWNIEPLEIPAVGTSGQSEVESEGDEDSENDGIEMATDRATTSHPPVTNGHLAFSDFLHFLELGCQGSAVQSYPAIVIVLSTIPESIFSYHRGDLESLFTSFWAAYDSKALNVLPRDRESTFKAFLSSLLDCVIYIYRKLNTLPRPSSSLRNTPTLQPEDTLDLVPLEWIGHILQELIVGDLAQNLSIDAAGELIGNTMKKLELINQDITEKAWRIVWGPILIDQQADRTGNIIKLLSKIRAAVHEGGNIEAIDKTLRKKAVVGGDKSEGVDLAAEQAQAIIILWSYLDVMSTPWLVEVTSQVLDEDVFDGLVRSGEVQGIASFLNGYLNAPEIPASTRNAVWARFLSTCTRATAFTVLRGVLDLMEVHELSPDESSALYDISKSWAAELVAGNAMNVNDLSIVIVHWKKCLTQTQATEVLQGILNAFVACAREVLFTPSTEVAPSVVESIAQVLSVIPGHHETSDFLNLSTLNFLDAAAFLRILPVLSEVSTPFASLIQCGLACKSWSIHAPAELQSAASSRAKEVMKNLLINFNTFLSARDILTVAIRSTLYSDEKAILLEMIPSQLDLDRDLDDLNDNPSPLLAESDPLVRLSEREPDSVALTNYDLQGLSKYARVGAALATLLSEDRQLARDNLWAFRHLLALQQFCSDFVSAASWPSDVFQAGASNQVHSLTKVITPLVIYLGNSLLADHPAQWHNNTISRLQKHGPDAVTPHSPEDVVCQHFSIALHISPSSRDLRILRRIMQFVLRDSEADILDMWSGFAQSAYTQHPEAGEAIGSVIAARGVESPRLDRWRNDIAGRIPGVSISNINQVGIPLLRALNCLAPPPDSGIIFMPQQRAIYLVQALQKWMSSDEELDSSLETLLTVLLNHLLPILQTIRGAHWEFILDILESNLVVEANITNLCLLLQSLRAISAILDLARTNEQLKEVWTPRQHDILQGVLQLFLSSSNNVEQSETYDKYYSCLADVIQAVPPKQIQSTHFDEFLSLVTSENIPVKLTAHYLARNALAQITEQLVLEAAVSAPPEDYEGPESTEADKFRLPPTLIDKLVPPDSVEGESLQINLLLAWWLALEFFDNTSLKVKQSYLDQLRKLNLVKTSLIPCLFGLLNIGASGEKPFNLGPWHVDEFYLSLYDKSFASSQSVLAAHIYFKSLKSIPGLIRTWYSECQDRQLSASISTYTKTHFSPVLINYELAQFRSSAASASEALADDTFTLKVAPSVNEISATYAVDEQEAFEVAIRLPSEFPLRAAEVKDVRGVAGMENRRRAWLFGVQNTTQQGLIYDALVMYKKNVAGHFEGKSECAICYSLISVTDRTLPTKPCRTCKNLFHASCLYKWFNTSHTSSCPLCRSDIF